MDGIHEKAPICFSQQCSFVLLVQLPAFDGCGDD
jgi:hypothetical protein